MEITHPPKDGNCSCPKCYLKTKQDAFIDGYEKGRKDERAKKKKK